MKSTDIPSSEDVRSGSGEEIVTEKHAESPSKSQQKSTTPASSAESTHNETSKTPVTSTEFIELLDSIGVSPEDAITLLLGNQMARKSPEEEKAEWKKTIASAGLIEKEVEDVLDSFLTEGNYSENYSIRGKVSLTLKTRQVSDNDELLRELTNQTVLNSGILPQEDSTRMTYQYNLAGSLAEYKDSNRSLAKDTSLAEKLDFVRELPEQMFNILCNILRKFDTKVYLATQLASIENF